MTSEKAHLIFTKLIENWHMCMVTDAQGMSGGLLTARSPHKVDLLPYLTSTGILVEGRVKNWDDLFRMVNCYVPYFERKAF